MPHKDPEALRQYLLRTADRRRQRDKERYAKKRDERLAYHKEWRAKNGDMVRANLRKHSYKHKSKKRALLDKVKIAYGCQNPNCPCQHPLPPCCYDFHHIDPLTKIFTIGGNAQAISKLVAEINKCTVLCAVCHRMETWGELDTTAFVKCKIDIDGNQIV